MTGKIFDATEIIDIENLINKYLSHQIKSIYAYMYCSSHQGMGDIIQIPKKNLKFFDSKKLRKYNPCLIYVWGWPGPDYNTYYFQDYGKTWAFSKEELESNINTRSYREIPQEDIILSSWDNRLFEEFKDGVYCQCGEVIRFKNRKPYETVKIICPKCGSEILYG